MGLPSAVCRIHSKSRSHGDAIILRSISFPSAKLACLCPQGSPAEVSRLHADYEKWNAHGLCSHGNVSKVIVLSLKEEQ